MSAIHNINSGESNCSNPLDDKEMIRHIRWHDQHIATIIRYDYTPDETTFVTPDSYYQQAGFIVYPKGGEVKRHTHLPIQRHLTGTPEALLVRKGQIEIELYSLDKELLGIWTLGPGDLILLVAGGHCCRCLQDSILLEIKQGPYTGLVEKEHY